MTSFNPHSYLRKIPVDLLRRQLTRRGVDLSAAANWASGRKEIADDILALARGSDPAWDRFLAEAERIAEMADDVGQVAIYSIANGRHDELDANGTGIARAAWLLLEHPRDFARAEAIRFTDHKRHGRMWDGFNVPKRLDLVRDRAALERLKEQLRSQFQSPHIEIDVFERRRHGADGAEVDLFQLVVYREGRLEDLLQFDNEGTLETRQYRPVHEASLTYEPEAGLLEAVVAGTETREAFAAVCAECLLQHPPGERLELRRFDLNRLLRSHAFETDPEDRIQSVSLDSIRLKPIDADEERVVLQTVGRSRGSIWRMADGRFGSHNPLNGGWLPTQAKLTVRFEREPGHGHQRSLSVTITMPHACDLKDRTQRERLIGDKYLRRWGLVRDGR